MHQKKYVTYMLKRFNMANCNNSKTLVDIGVKLVKEDN